MEEVQYYFISVGEKSYFYTLRYFYHKKIWSTNENGQHSFELTTGSRHVRNLNHDFDIAVSIAKEYMANKKSKMPLHTKAPTETMNERADVTSITAYEEKLSNKIFLSGKNVGCHVSEVDKSYVLWSIINLHNDNAPLEQKRRNTTLINGKICFDYATEQGWLNEWLTEGENLLKSENNSDMDEINRILDGDVFHIGKYRNESLAEFGYTKKKQLRSAVVDYLIYMSKQETSIDRIIKKGKHEYVEHDDGLDEVFITTDMLQAESISPHSIRHDGFILTVLMCRHLCYKLGIGKRFGHTKFIFKYQSVENTDMEKLKRSLKHLYEQGKEE